jgi:hypothetical protein
LAFFPFFCFFSCFFVFGVSRVFFTSLYAHFGAGNFRVFLALFGGGGSGCLFSGKVSDYLAGLRLSLAFRL